ncbi:unnamed protein product [Amoebophrya sp. A120]|nr:unnamed protein product [Amoebophrya sp. A120]|eukprot:GSA120T00020133001.1
MRSVLEVLARLLRGTSFCYLLTTHASKRKNPVPIAEETTSAKCLKDDHGSSCHTAGPDDSRSRIDGNTQVLEQAASNKSHHVDEASQVFSYTAGGELEAEATAETTVATEPRGTLSATADSALDSMSEQSADAAKVKTFYDSFPTVVIGCWQLTERLKNNEKAVELLQEYYRNGFHHFDTADIYGPSETLLGFARQAIRLELLQNAKNTGNKTDLDFHVFTKYVPSGPQESALRINQLSRKALFQEDFRKKEQDNDYPLELVQFHWWNFADRGHIQGARDLMSLQAEGKIEHLAVTNFDTVHLRELIEKAQFPVRVNQVQFSLLDRRPENGVLQLAKKHQFKLTCFGSVAGGWLSEKFLGMESDPMRSSRKFQESSTVSLRMYYSSLMSWCRGDWDLFQRLLRTLEKIANATQTKIAVVATWWVLQKLETDGFGGAVIIGVRDAKHLDETKIIQSGGKQRDNTGKKIFLAADHMEAIQQVLDQGTFPTGEDIWSRERGD